MVLSGQAGDALFDTTSRPREAPDAGSLLPSSSSSWSRIAEAASIDAVSTTTMDSATAVNSGVAVDGGASVGGSDATTAGSSRSSGTTAAEPLPLGVPRPSGQRSAGAEGDAGVAEEEAGLAVTEDLAGLVVRWATTENLVRSRLMGLWVVKILVILYLATCLWSVVTALVEAVVRLITPVLTFFGFMLWILGA
jgi:hypothetical protein